MVFSIKGRKYTRRPPLKVMMLGFRGFPGVQGGIEKHAENLCPLLVRHGISVNAIVRKPYVSEVPLPVWKGVHRLPVWAPQSAHFEALLHSFLGVLVAALRRPDVLHIHGIGPALVTPLARLFGLTVIVTHHGPDYDREKWGLLARCMLRAGELTAVLASHRVIAVSRTVEKLISERYGKTCDFIPNGIHLPDIPATTDRLAAFDLERRRYVLTVGRLVPEKRQLDLIEAFARARLGRWKLVIVGDIDHANPYADRLAKIAAETPNVVLTGFQTGETLRELYAHAGLFVLPSSHEGLPIALLEAMSFGLPVLVSDIPAHLEIALSPNNYFRVADVESLAGALKRRAVRPVEEEELRLQRFRVAQRFNWDNIASKTIAVYHKLADPFRGGVVKEAKEANLEH